MTLEELDERIRALEGKAEFDFEARRLARRVEALENAESKRVIKKLQEIGAAAVAP